MSISCSELLVYDATQTIYIKLNQLQAGYLDGYEARRVSLMNIHAPDCHIQSISSPAS